MRNPFLCLLFVALGLPAHAILMRADRDDAEYLEMATKYTSYVALGVPDGGGVLIHPRWVLTAAQMAKVVESQKNVKLRIGRGEYAVERVVVHPDWKKGGPSDIGLLMLKDAVPDIEPTPLHREADEIGKTIIIVGSGYTGKIGEKPSKEKWDRKARAAVNTIDKLGPRTLFVNIKSGDDASDLQGAAAPGDSGGPAFIETPEGVRVVGIGYATDDTNANGIVGDAGDVEIYARASAFVTWVEAVMVDAARQEADRLMGGDPR